MQTHKNIEWLPQELKLQNTRTFHFKIHFNKPLIVYLMIAMGALLMTSSLAIFVEFFSKVRGVAWINSINPSVHLETVLSAAMAVVVALMLLWIGIFIEHLKKEPWSQPKETLKEVTLQKEKVQNTAFLESISHEIRTPLNGIIGYAEYIQHTSEESMIQFPAQIIFESSQHLLRLIDNLLDLTEIETQRMKMKMIPFNLNASIDEVCKSHKSRSNKKNILLKYEYDPQCPPVVVLDESLFRKVISNLLDNAIVFSKDIGEIVLTVHYLKNIHSLYVSIKDDGHGIPEKMHSHVFDKFWQMEDFIANAHGGSSLGLALTQKMVAMMGGEINFNSAENVGSIFYFTLPLIENGPPT